MTTTGITINGMGNTVDIANLPFVQGATATFNPSNDVVTVISGNEEATLTENNAGTNFAAVSDGKGGTDVVPVCFASGTRIATARGDIVVEMLAVGDLVVTATGAHRPIVWIGQRTIDCTRHPRPNEVLPVRITAHAFGDNRPVRDLFVSPGHALCVDVVGEVLIPASALVNGTTIVQDDDDRVTYWHVELDSHDILLAENMPAESYLEMGNRSFFAGGDVVVLDARPDAAAATHTDFCRPFHAAGPVVEFVRERLWARALRSGWTAVENPLADLHLVVDGRRLEPDVDGLVARFFVPASADTVWLMSDTVVPAMAGGGADLRSLGLSVGRIVVDDGFGPPRSILAEDPCFCVGFHHVEDGSRRWTAGRARLPSEMWKGFRGSFFLRVELTRPSLPRWIKTDLEQRVALAG